MKNIRAGALRTPVFLGRVVLGQDDAGAQTVTWEEKETWAAIEPLRGKEWLSTATVKDAVDVLITLRLIPDWTPVARWRVRDAITGALYDLVTVMLQPKFGSAECLAHSVQGNSDAR